MRLVIADEDASYRFMLSRSIRESEWRRKVTVVLADGRDSVHSTAVAEANAALADPAWCIRLKEGGFRGTVICLAETRDTEELAIGGHRFPCLFKYQSLHSLMSDLLVRLDRQQGGASTMIGGNPGDCRVVAVYSASGGAGKSSFSVGLAEWLAAAGYRTFLLNMERIPGVQSNGSGEKKRFAMVLYHMRRGEHDALFALAERHPDKGFDGFPAAGHAGEWNEYGAADFRELVGLLKRSGRWDFVVADCETALTELTETALATADERFWLEVDDEVGRAKSAFAQRMLSISSGADGQGGWHFISVPPASRSEPDFADCLGRIGITGEIAFA